MKIKSKIPQTSSKNTVKADDLVETTADSHHDHVVFHWDSDRLMFKSPTGDAFVCQIIKSNDSEAVYQISAIEDERTE